MKRLRYTLLVCLLTLLACRETIVVKEHINKLPDIFPDYTGVTIPSTIAPLNFKYNGQYNAIAAEFTGNNGQILKIRGKQTIDIPIKKWEKLLSNNIGDSLQVTVSIKKENDWFQYSTFAIYISSYPIDYGLAYRRIAPGYEVFSHMGIYDRELSSFNESPIVENTLFPGSCVNCHSFQHNNASTMMFHLRGPSGGTILNTSDGLQKLITKTDQTIGNFQYPYWHPSGKFIAYSVNKTAQTFHSSNPKRVEVFDSESDVLVYNIDQNTILTTKAICSPDWYETWPSFAPKDSSLYFATAPAQPMPVNYNNIKYSLCRIGFNSQNGSFGNKVDTLFNAFITNKSIAFPRISPDGNYLLATTLDYGNFPIWHKESDLLLFDLQSGTSRYCDEINSGDVDSYHSWSTNGRWIVFSSRRINGLYTMPYLAFFDENGNFGKPFLLPQKSPDYYDNTLYSFNIPEFINAPVQLNIRELGRTVQSPGKNVTFMQTGKK